LIRKVGLSSSTEGLRPNLSLNWSLSWASPPREKFYLSTEELKMVGLALNYYKKCLRSQKKWEKVEKIADLDNRLFDFLAFLEAKPLEEPQLSH
jgi:hypothetical protein